MKTLTIDTSVILAVLLGESTRDSIIRLTQGANLIAPASLDAEIGNALSAQMKRGKLSVEQARLAIQSFRDIPIRQIPLRLEEALDLSGRFSMYAYDAYVLDTALAKSTPLLTLDQRMVDVAKTLNMTIIDL